MSAIDTPGSLLPGFPAENWGQVAPRMRPATNLHAVRGAGSLRSAGSKILCDGTGFVWLARRPSLRWPAGWRARSSHAGRTFATSAKLPPPGDHASRANRRPATRMSNPR